MRRISASVCALLAALAPGTASAQGDPGATPAAVACAAQDEGGKKDDWVRQPSAQSSVTAHRFSAGGTAFDYVATAGTLVLRDDDDRPIANMGYIAYTRSDGNKAASRPILFAFNGGPGSSSVWLHLGLLGPKRVLVEDAGPTPAAPARMVDNEFGMLDMADVVLIDPVGTGLSRSVCSKKDPDFWGTDADADSVSRFIAQYVSDNNRWTSPKYILGESYGTTRAAAVVNYLRVCRSLTFNGIILLSLATDIEAIYSDLPGNDRPYPLFLPAFAAAAWYHNLLPGARPPLEPFLDEARRFAEGPFAAALRKGNALSDAERDAVVEQVHRYTGLSVAYIKASNLRISEFAFAQELMRSQGRMVSRLDARFAGVTQDTNEKNAAYDPLLSNIGPAFNAALQDYLHRDLKFGEGQTYRASNFEIGNKWDWSHHAAGTTGERQPLVNSGVDLARTMIEDPNLRVLVLNGYFDLGSPFSAAEYMISHLQVPKSLTSRIRMEYYEAGHMMYVHAPSLRKLKVDLDAFLRD